MQNKEIWKDIPGFEGYYQVSNLGNIKSLDRITPAKNRWGQDNPRRYKGKPLKPQCSKVGYYVVKLNMRKFSRSYFIHHLVMKSFIPNPDPLRLSNINHKDGNKINNRLENLEWCTPEQNTRHGIKMGLTTVPGKGTNNPRAQLVEKQVHQIRKLYKTGQYTYNQLGDMFGISKHAIADIVLKRNWQHI